MEPGDLGWIYVSICGRSGLAVETTAFGARCSVLGVLQEEGMGIEVDQKKAIELYGKACELAAAPACTLFAARYHDQRAYPVAPWPPTAEVADGAR